MANLYVPGRTTASTCSSIRVSLLQCLISSAKLTKYDGSGLLKLLFFFCYTTISLTFHGNNWVHHYRCLQRRPKMCSYPRFILKGHFDSAPSCSFKKVIWICTWICFSFPWTGSPCCIFQPFFLLNSAFVFCNLADE